MKKFIIILLVAGVIVFFGLRLFKEKVGDIVPALVPTQENLSQRIIEAQRTGNRPDIPLILPSGFEIGVFQDDLAGARDIEFASNGTLLLSQPGQGKVVALPDKNNDGKADSVITLITGLNKPHGLAFNNSYLFIAEEKKIDRYKYDLGSDRITFDKKLFDLPTGGRHTSRTLLFDKDNNLYVAIGSTCDVCVEKDPFISTVIISDSEGKDRRVYSKGLRNPVFLALHPETGKIFTTEMGRDNLGDNLPPDEINIMKDGGNYGWPFCYGDQTWDKLFGQKTQTYCDTTIKPFYNIPAHSAPLGLTFITSSQMPEEWQNDLLVAYHGSWNRSTPTGYKIVRISTKGTPSEEDFISGFIEGRQALGRPVDVVFDKAGSLFISDDKGNAVYKMVKSK